MGEDAGHGSGAGMMFERMRWHEGRMELRCRRMSVEESEQD